MESEGMNTIPGSSKWVAHRQKPDIKSGHNLVIHSRPSVRFRKAYFFPVNISSRSVLESGYSPRSRVLDVSFRRLLSGLRIVSSCLFDNVDNSSSGWLGGLVVCLVLFPGELAGEVYTVTW